MENNYYNYAFRIIKPLMLIVAFWLLLRGHNEPGGGFIGGLIAASAYILEALGSGRESKKKSPKVSPVWLMALGILFVLFSAAPSLIKGLDFLTGVWIEFSVFSIIPVKIGTPLLFDTGVLLTVFGFTLTVIINLMEEWKWK